MTMAESSIFDRSHRLHRRSLFIELRKKTTKNDGLALNIKRPLGVDMDSLSSFEIDWWTSSWAEGFTPRPARLLIAQDIKFSLWNLCGVLAKVREVLGASKIWEASGSCCIEAACHFLVQENKQLLIWGMGGLLTRG
jgi:hypothetical protein